MKTLSKASLISDEGQTVEVQIYKEKNKITAVSKAHTPFIFFDFDEKLTILLHDSKSTILHSVNFIEVKIVKGRFYYQFQVIETFETTETVRSTPNKLINGVLSYNNKLEHCQIDQYTEANTPITTSTPITNRILNVSFKFNSEQIRIYCKVVWYEKKHNVHKYGLYSIKR